MSSDHPRTTTTGPAGFAFRFPFDMRENVRVTRMTMRLRRRWQRIVLWMFLILVLPYFSVTFLEYVRGTRELAEVLSSSLPFALLCYFGWGHPWVLAWSIQKQLGGPRVEVGVSVDDAGVGSLGPKASLSLRWAAVRRVVDTGDLLLFYVSWAGALYLPRRAVHPRTSGERSSRSWTRACRSGAASSAIHRAGLESREPQRRRARSPCCSADC
jgi:hypothetical protein